MNVQTLLEDLAWQVEAGADEAIEEQAGFLHWKSPEKRAQVAPIRDRKESGLDLSALSAPLAPLMPAKPVDFGVHVPVAASSLAELKAELERFDGCELKHTAMNLVFDDGNPDADIMIIGDAPAEDEDRQGRPFAGPNGQLLDKMLASIGLDRNAVYLTNLVYWRPPGNRTPSDVEIAACQPFLQQHIRLKAPKLLILCGALTVKHLLRTKEPFSKRRGKWTEYVPPLSQGEAGSVPCLPIYHPSYLLRQPSAKRLAWYDLLMVKRKWAELSS